MIQPLNEIEAQAERHSWRELLRENRLLRDRLFFARFINVLQWICLAIALVLAVRR